MGNSLGGNSLGGMSGSFGGYGSQTQCCEPVVDPISLITTIGGIAALSLYLRQAVIDFMIKMGRRKKRSNQQDSWLTFDNIDDIVEFFVSGNFYLYEKVLT